MKLTARRAWAQTWGQELNRDPWRPHIGYYFPAQNKDRSRAAQYDRNVTATVKERKLRSGTRLERRRGLRKVRPGGYCPERAAQGEER
ncbi:MAG: hypothetical protein HYS04_19160 [Acidobacteria bacterium]|nr:hypothetical protein [Acidobacteriota bacterium]